MEPKRKKIYVYQIIGVLLSLGLFFFIGPQYSNPGELVRAIVDWKESVTPHEPTFFERRFELNDTLIMANFSQWTSVACSSGEPFLNEAEVLSCYRSCFWEFQHSMDYIANYSREDTKDCISVNGLTTKRECYDLKRQTFRDMIRLTVEREQDCFSSCPKDCAIS